MDVEDDLRRVLRERNLDVPVRAGAEWSVMAGARRRRQRHNAVAALGGAVAAMMLAGSAVALGNYRSPEPVSPPPVPPVLHSSRLPGESPGSQVSKTPSGEPSGGQRTWQPDPGQWTEPPYSSSESAEEPTILRDSVTSEPETSPSEPTSSSSEPETTDDEPSSTTSEPGE